jgi:hypothetical protein
MPADTSDPGSRNQNGWNEYSKLVLKELETLGDGIDGLRSEVHSVKHEIAKMQVREDKVDELREWKKRMDETANINQINMALKEIDELKQFRTKAITIFAVVQFVVVVAFSIVIKLIT